MEKENSKLTEQVKEKIKEKVIEEVTPTEEEAEQMKAIFESVNQPIEFTDKDFKLGGGELDIRNLSMKNQNQVYFRLMAQNVTLQKQMCQLQIDNQRLMILLLTKMGVKPEELGKELGELLIKLEKAANKQTNKA